MTSLLEAVDITKNFGGVRALKGVSFALAAGEVHALVGENGAGKSTLIKVLTGAIQPDSGELWLQGGRLQQINPLRARSLGIAAVYQQPALFPQLSVAENIALTGDSGRPWHRVNWTQRYARAAELLERVGARVRPHAVVADLSPAERQLVEIAKALNKNARVVILDEPTSSLGEQETEHLYGIVDNLRASGVAVVYISHRFKELVRLADRVTVLRDGSSIGTHSMQSLTEKDLISMMVGRKIDTVFPATHTTPGAIALEARHLTCLRSGVQDVSFTLRRGEILGLAGLIGSGRTQLAEALFGITPADSGEVFVDGHRARIRTPSDALAAGLAYVPEDRRRHGVIMDLPIDRNVSLAGLRSVARSGLVDRRRERQVAQEFTASLAIKAPSVQTIVRGLSGGNQQKVALARWLFTDPKILIFDEPTQGIDVGAKAEIYHLIAKLASGGMAILMISSELPEILGMSDRIAVMCRGRIAGVLAREEATAQSIMELALGHSSDPLQGVTA